eukprot:Colp12_sorted_trinity150504_noHs@21456
MNKVRPASKGDENHGDADAVGTVPFSNGNHLLRYTHVHPRRPVKNVSNRLLASVLGKESGEWLIRIFNHPASHAVNAALLVASLALALLVVYGIIDGTRSFVAFLCIAPPFVQQFLLLSTPVFK